MAAKEFKRAREEACEETLLRIHLVVPKHEVKARVPTPLVG